jgi:hypothetical protein
MATGRALAAGRIFPVARGPLPSARAPGRTLLRWLSGTAEPRPGSGPRSSRSRVNGSAVRGIAERGTLDIELFFPLVPSRSPFDARKHDGCGTKYGLHQ